MTSFGSSTPKKSVRKPFDFWVMRDDEPEKHSFQARVVTDIASLMVVVSAGDRDSAKAMVGVGRIISKMLDNKDGTPARWVPSQLPPPDGAGEDYQPRFRGPDGELYTMDHVDRFERFEAGSSRRRWLYLMLEDDEIVVEAKDLMRLMEWLVALASDRPTEPSTS